MLHSGNSTLEIVQLQHYTHIHGVGGTSLPFTNPAAQEANMATVSDFIPSAAPLKNRFETMVASFIEGAQRRKVYRTTFNELQNLSNRELSDLGIGRSEIRRIALEAAENI